ncbi:LPXTG cell wall anchor domain-containing protein [Alkalibaculum sp. M08DMB]|uniref:LPXTG cell wall anchor domain-containing protein n=1 Tax=Alkalibaculum sporogenes TaxID=2655001 RepID=A0A6A7K7G2_9FIRM|nr:DUF6273 domain-containing protein [Alkalibaculum sporogenes]MPW25439.1 LPXTG cell wall anchor domain-containing protein [Alkalibaculum sporogenes]
MRKKRLNKALAIALSTVMIICAVNFVPGSVIEVKADAPTVKDVNLGFGGIKNPTSTGTDATAWAGSKVYYGSHLWRVLDKSGFLFSEEFLGMRAYNNTYNSITWEGCTLRAYLNGTNNAGGAGTLLGNTFTTAEQGAINLSTVTNENNPVYGTLGGNDTTDKLFLLSLAEVNNATYGFGSHFTKSALYWWWLRSPGFNGMYGAEVSHSGFVNVEGLLVDNSQGVRPAFHLNLSSVLFTFARGASKSSFGSVGDSNVSANQWKLTLKGADATLSAQTTGGATSLQTGYSAENLTINHSTATTLTGASQVSAMLTDSNGTVLYYGSINSNTAATSSNVTIPAGLSVGSYSLYVFAEDVNTGDLTDYASAFGTAIPITVSAPLSTYDVTITAGSYTTKTANSGEATQTGLTGAMTDIVYTANDGYYFPTDYNSDNSLNTNGITVTRDSYTQITVSGTPAANTSVTLAPATEKATQNAPAGLSDGVDKIAGTTTVMEYAASPTATTWNTCTDSNTTVVAGTWYVRYKETDTQKAGATRLVTVTTAPNPPTLYQVTVNNGSGDGTYVKGATVTITAGSPASGKQFKNWTVESGSANLASSTSETTTFTMPAGELVITATYENVTTQTETYVIKSGANGTHQIGSDGTLTITCSGALNDLTGIYVDGNLVDSSNYTLKSGSTILTFHADYLNGLGTGKHTVRFQYGENSVETSFEIAAADSDTTDSKASDTDTGSSGKDDVPKTGDHTPIGGLIVLTMISGVGVFYFIRRKKFIEK